MYKILMKLDKAVTQLECKMICLPEIIHTFNVFVEREGWQILRQQVEITVFHIYQSLLINTSVHICNNIIQFLSIDLRITTMGILKIIFTRLLVMFDFLFGNKYACPGKG